MKEKEYNYFEENMKSRKKLVEKGEEDLKKEFSEKGTYYNENKDFLNLSKDNAVFKKYEREIQDYDSRIEFYKNTLEYRIQDVYTIVEEMNESIEPYISVTDSMAKVQISFYEKDEDKLNKEFEILKKEKDSLLGLNEKYTEEEEQDRYEKLTEEEKKRYKELTNNIKEKEKGINEIKTQIKYYESRDELTNKYKENLKTMEEMRKLAQKYSLKEPISKQNKKVKEEKKEQKSEHQEKLINGQTKGQEAQTQTQVASGPVQTAQTQEQLEPGKEMPERDEAIETSSDDKEKESTSLPPLKAGTKVIVGRKGQISYDGEKYKISSKTIKKALNMTPTEVIRVMKDNGLEMSKEQQDEIKLGIKNNTLDSTVLAGICAARKMPEETKEILLKHYLEDGIKALNKEDTKNSLNLTYDQNDLSKSSILKRIFRREVNSDEKYEMMKKARVGERYGIAKTEGEYEPDKKSRLISFLSRNKIQKLPTMKETIEVAELYNEMRTNDKDDKKTDAEKDKFRNSLKTKTKGFSEAQLTEFKELKESQEKQEKQEEPEK